MNKVTIIITILLFASCANRATTNRGNEDNTNAIRKYGIVSFRRIGFAGTYIDDYIRIWKIAKISDAESKFTMMIEEPDLDTKLYALMGLKIISSDKYKVYRKRISKIKSEVRYGGGGCMISVMPVSDIVEIIDQSQLLDPNED